MGIQKAFTTDCRKRAGQLQILTQCSKLPLAGAALTLALTLTHATLPGALAGTLAATALLLVLLTGAAAIPVLLTRAGLSATVIAFFVFRSCHVVLSLMKGRTVLRATQSRIPQTRSKGGKRLKEVLAITWPALRWGYGDRGPIPIGRAVVGERWGPHPCAGRGACRGRMRSETAMACLPGLTPAP